METSQIIEWIIKIVTLAIIPFGAYMYKTIQGKAEEQSVVDRFDKLAVKYEKDNKSTTDLILAQNLVIKEMVTQGSLLKELTTLVTTANDKLNMATQTLKDKSDTIAGDVKSIESDLKEMRSNQIKTDKELDNIPNRVGIIEQEMRKKPGSKSDY